MKHDAVHFFHNFGTDTKWAWQAKQRILKLQAFVDQTHCMTQSKSMHVPCLFWGILIWSQRFLSCQNPNRSMGVSKNRGTPKWMVYRGKPYKNGWFGGQTPIFGNIQMVLKPTRGFDSWQAIDDFHIGPFSVYKQTFGVAAQFQMARWGMTPPVW